MGIGPYGSVTRGAAKRAVGDAGPYGSITRGAAKWAVEDAGPYESVTRRCGAGKNPPVTALSCQPPLGKGAEGTGMRIATAGVRTGFAMTGFCRECGKESPSHGFAVPALFRQGSRGDGDADCHDQFANWSRNDMVYYGRKPPGGGGLCPWEEEMHVSDPAGRG